MSEQEATADISVSVDVPPEGEAKTFDEVYVKKLRDEAAKYRTEAKANAKAVEELAGIKESQKSDAQKAADRLADAEKDAQDARSEALRWRIAAAHSISDEDADLFLTGTDEDTLNKQAARLAQHASDRKKNGNVVPNEGASTTSKPDQMREFTRSLFGTGD